MFKSLRVLTLSSLVFSLLSCTTIKTSSGHTNSGIPYYLPMPALIVKQPIELSRVEKLHAVVLIGGITTALYEFHSDMPTAIDDLKRLVGLASGTSVILKAVPTQAHILTESSVTKEVTSEVKTEEHKSSKNIQKSIDLKKYVIASQPTDSSALSYVPDDVSKSYDVKMLPNFQKPFMLHIEPGIFGGDVSAALTDGWQLTSVNGKMDASAAIGSLTDMVEAFVTAKKDVKVTELTEESKLELERLKQASVTPSGDAQGLLKIDSVAKTLEVKIVGYVKEVEISAIKPGVYDLSNITAFSFTTLNNTIWERVGI